MKDKSRIMIFVSLVMNSYSFGTLFQIVDQLCPTFLELIDLFVEISQFHRIAAVEMFIEKLQTMIQGNNRLSDVTHFRLGFLNRENIESFDCGSGEEMRRVVLLMMQAVSKVEWRYLLG